MPRIQGQNGRQIRNGDHGVSDLKGGHFGLLRIKGTFHILRHFFPVAGKCSRFVDFFSKFVENLAKL